MWVNEKYNHIPIKAAKWKIINITNNNIKCDNYKFNIVNLNLVFIIKVNSEKYRARVCVESVLKIEMCISFVKWNVWK